MAKMPLESFYASGFQGQRRSLVHRLINAHADARSLGRPGASSVPTSGRSAPFGSRARQATPRLPMMPAPFRPEKAFEAAVRAEVARGGRAGWLVPQPHVLISPQLRHTRCGGADLKFVAGRHHDSVRRCHHPAGQKHAIDAGSYQGASSQSTDGNPKQRVFARKIRRSSSFVFDLDDPRRLQFSGSCTTVIPLAISYGAVATKMSLIGAVRRSILRRRSLHPNPT